MNICKLQDVENFITSSYKCLMNVLQLSYDHLNFLRPSNKYILGLLQKKLTAHKRFNYLYELLMAYLKPSQTCILNILKPSYNLFAKLLQMFYKHIKLFLNFHKCLANFFQSSNCLMNFYKLPTNFLLTSYKRLTNFLQTSYKLLTSFLQTSY
jgi:hypothetical protein